MRSLVLAVLTVYFLLSGTQAAAMACNKAMGHGVSGRQSIQDRYSSIFESLPERYHETARTLLEVQEQGQSIAVSEPGTSGDSRGVVSKVRVEDETLVFDLDGKTYRPFHSFSIRVLEVATSEVEILAAVPEGQRASVTLLLKAQVDGDSIAITEPGIMGEARGQVSNIRVEDGQLLFDIDGKMYEPFYGFQVRVLEVARDESDVLSQVLPNQREAVETLLMAQAEGNSVAISESGVMGETRGQVSNIRVEDGQLLFDIDGKRYEPLYGISITVLEVVRDAADILVSVRPNFQEAARVLLQAEEEGRAVAISESGVVGEARGRASNIRAEDGQLLFDLDGNRYEPSYGTDIRVLDGTTRHQGE